MNKRIEGVLFLVAKFQSSKLEKTPDYQLLWKSKELEQLEKSNSLNIYLSMAVIVTPKAYEKWNNHIQLGLNVFTPHQESVLDYSSNLEEAIKQVTFDGPSCILVGKQDDSVYCHYTQAYELIERFPRATFAVLDGAGHILQIDRCELNALSSAKLTNKSQIK